MFHDTFDLSNYMHRAVIHVAYKFAHELSLYDMLRKVRTLMLCHCHNLTGVNVTVNLSISVRVNVNTHKYCISSPDIFLIL